jgi:hypothetical protein
MSTPHNGPTIDATVVRPKRQVNWKPWIGPGLGLAVAAGVAALIIIYGVPTKTDVVAPPVSIAGVTTDELTTFGEELRKDISADVDKKLQPITDRLTATEKTATAAHDGVESLTGSLTTLTASVNTVAANVAAIDKRLTTYIESDAAREARWQQQYEELKALVSNPAPAEPETPAEPATPAEPEVVVVDEPPPVEPVTDPATIWMDEIVAACPDANVTIEIVRGMGKKWVDEFIRGCSAYTAVVEGPAAPVVKISGGGSDTSCSISVEVRGGRTVPVYIRAGGRTVSDEYQVRGIANIPVPCNVVRTGVVEVCFRGTGESELINGTKLRRMRDQYEQALARGLDRVVLNGWGPIWWAPG